MGHWARVDNGTVTEVVVADDDKQAWLTEALGGVWVQTSYNTRGGVHLLGGEPLRGNYAGIGYVYDEARDCFYPPQPFPSWVLDEATCLWEAPTPMPEDGNAYSWNEATTSWELISEA